MGLFSKIKRQMLKVIEWEDDSKDTIVYRYPLTDRDEIMTSSTLVVRESQCAIFMHKGQIADVFAPGTYTLSTENIPFLTKLLSLPTGFESKIKAEVYFVNTKQFIGQKWGTQNPIMIRDPEYGNVRIRGFGVFSFKVSDAKVFMREVFGTNAVYKTSDVADTIKPMLIQAVTDRVAESKMSALDFAANYKEFAQTVQENCVKDFEAMGLSITKFVIENISLPEEVEKTLDERTKLGVLEDKLGTYTKLKAADALGDAAKNTSSGNMAGLGIGLGAGSAVGNLFAESLSTENPVKLSKTNTKQCSVCGASVKANAKFCPECGVSLVKKCAKCGTVVDDKSKFCPECGNKLINKTTCPDCNTEVKANAKFCPNCGKKLG